MNDAFFTATKHALKNITDVFDTVWPISVSLWNLRYMVSGVKQENPNISEAMMAHKFTTGSGVHGVNYTKTFLNQSWEKQQENVAWILLNAIFPIYEGWLEALKHDAFADMDVKSFQYPDRVKREINKLNNNSSTILKRCFYEAYSKKRDREYDHIMQWLTCFRVYKEIRNCYMHAGKIADEKLVKSYNEYLPYATNDDLLVKEVPDLARPILDQYICLNLRGVVAFSYIMTKIIVTIDAELICSIHAEKEFLIRFKKKHNKIRILKSEIKKANKQVEQYVRQSGFVTPKEVDVMREY